MLSPAVAYNSINRGVAQDFYFNRKAPGTQREMCGTHAPWCHHEYANGSLKNFTTQKSRSSDVKGVNL